MHGVTTALPCHQPLLKPAPYPASPLALSIPVFSRHKGRLLMCRLHWLLCSADRWDEIEERVQETVQNCDLNLLIAESSAMAANHIQPDRD